MSILLIFIVLLILYTILIYYYSLWLYNNSYKYYRPIKNPIDSKKDVHSIYPEFRLDFPLKFSRLFFGSFFFLPFRAFCFCFLGLVCELHFIYVEKFYKNPETNKESFKHYIFPASFYTWCFTKAMNVKYNKIKVKEIENIYKKYLGENYDFTLKDFCCYICNHTGFFEVLYNMSEYHAGFMSKEDVLKIPFIGRISKGVCCLYVNRENQKNRDEIFNLLQKRLNDYYNKKNLFPLVMFPEGTTTNGKYILSFKKGTFMPLLPVKPEVIGVYPEDEFNLACGATNVTFILLRAMSFFGHRMFHIEMPVIKPTEFMFKNYKNFGKEKWEIYAEVCRRIMSEVGGLKMSDKSYRDMKCYNKAMISGVYDPDFGNNNDKKDEKENKKDK